MIDHEVKRRFAVCSAAGLERRDHHLREVDVARIKIDPFAAKIGILGESMSKDRSASTGNVCHYAAWCRGQNLDNQRYQRLRHIHVFKIGMPCTFTHRRFAFCQIIFLLKTRYLPPQRHQIPHQIRSQFIGTINPIYEIDELVFTRNELATHPHQHKGNLRANVCQIADWHRTSQLRSQFIGQVLCLFRFHVAYNTTQTALSSIWFISTIDICYNKPKRVTMSLFSF